MARCASFGRAITKRSMSSRATTLRKVGRAGGDPPAPGERGGPAGRARVVDDDPLAGDVGETLHVEAGHEARAEHRDPDLFHGASPRGSPARDYAPRETRYNPATPETRHETRKGIASHRRPPSPSSPDCAGPTHAFAREYPGDPTGRQPVHTVYGGAHLFKADSVAQARRARAEDARRVRARAPGPRRGPRSGRTRRCRLCAGEGQARARAGRGLPHRLRGRVRQPPRRGRGRGSGPRPRSRWARA